jgi:hypothetical protein
MLKFIILLYSFNVQAQKINSKVELTKNISIEASGQEFKASDHKLDTCDTGQGWRMICLIDNKPFFGTDDGLDVPRFQLDQLTLFLDKKKIRLDVTGMFNPSFSGKINSRQFKLEKDQPGYILHGFFSDGAGTYTVHWKIIKGRSVRVLISGDEKYFTW